MTPTSTKETKKYLATPTTMTPPFTPREVDQLLRFAADVAPRFRRLGRMSLRALKRSGGPLARLRFAPKDTGLWTTPPLVALQAARPLTGSSREPPRHR